MTAPDPAEQHFEAYLAGRGISYEYEKPAGDKRPDYWIPSDGGAVVCEVHHVTASPGSLPNRSGAFDVHAPLSKAIKRKSAQAIRRPRTKSHAGRCARCPGRRPGGVSSLC